MLHYRIQRKRRRSDSKKCASEILDARTLKQWRFLMIIWVSSTHRTPVIWQLCRQQDVLADSGRHLYLPNIGRATRGVSE